MGFNQILCDDLSFMIKTIIIIRIILSGKSTKKWLNRKRSSLVRTDPSI